MKPLKRALRSPVTAALAARLAALYIRIVRASGRWRFENLEAVDRLVAAGEPFIVCFWHGRMLMVPSAWRWRRRISILVSRHLDGQLIARVVARFGIDAVSGSSTRGGTAALRGLLAALGRGECVAITPDGPRGPCMQVGGVVIRLARRAGCAIVPVSYSARPGRSLASWDRFFVPAPFARGILAVGEPLRVGDRDDDAALARELEDRLNRLTAELDARLGRPAGEAVPATLRAAEGKR